MVFGNYMHTNQGVVAVVLFFAGFLDFSRTQRASFRERNGGGLEILEPRKKRFSHASLIITLLLTNK